jgi:flagellar assembly factor FliW
MPFADPLQLRAPTIPPGHELALSHAEGIHVSAQSVPFPELPQLVFKSGLPGFPGERHFTLVCWGAGDGPYSVMVDVDQPDVSFLVVPPYVFFPDYEVELDEATVLSLELEDPNEALVLVIVSLGERAQDATANLLGPLVINLRTNSGAQAVLSDSAFGTRVPLMSA